MDDKQYARISLTSGQIASFELPTNLNSRDIAILKSQIEVLELQMEDDEEKTPV
ncbi:MULTISPECIES: hypothetical protein [Bacillus amyloliquefaciens group]|uniref:hypothetical protein n=1 Tax=Bacillus amyloliquefaciens group TaxID=1938374 RepID=UPI00227FDF88|nr:hypothetical protein [Bacillus velezensis]MCY7442905.1 hypothetical protein [Bacillus velezensis]